MAVSFERRQPGAIAFGHGGDTAEHHDRHADQDGADQHQVEGAARLRDGGAVEVVNDTVEVPATPKHQTTSVDAGQLDQALRSTITADQTKCLDKLELCQLPPPSHHLRYPMTRLWPN